MPKQIDPALCDRIIAEAREDDERMSPAPWRTAKDGWVVWTSAMNSPDLAWFTPNTVADSLGIARTRNNLRVIADQLEAATAEAGRLGALVEVSPDDIRDVIAENDRLRAGFDEVIQKLRDGRPVRSAMCTWCGQHWPMLDGETIETFRKYTNKHAETCPAHDIRIERDEARARVADLEAVIARYDAGSHPVCECHHEQGDSACRVHGIEDSNGWIFVPCAHCDRRVDVADPRNCHGWRLRIDGWRCTDHLTAEAKSQ